MQKERMISLGEDVIYLAVSALAEKIPDRERLSKMDFSRVYRMASFHSMQAVVYFALKSAREAYGNDIIDADIYKRFEIDFSVTVKRLVTLEMERDALCKYLNEKGIWHIVLKGVVLQKDYRRLGMRQMADNDILFDKRYASTVRTFFSEKGYETVTYGKGFHDAYLKRDLLFEMHRSLVSEHKGNKKVSAYLKRVISESVKEQATTEKIFKISDFYVHFIIHTHKHFRSSGCGMRTLMDIYTFLDKHRDELDFSYIKRCLSEIDLSDFERDVRELSSALFDTAKVPESCVDLFLYFVSSGTFGNKRQQVENRLKRISQNKEITTRVKLKYLFKRVFPPLSYYKDNYLHLYRLILPIPFLWFYRIIKSIFKKDAISREMMHLKEASQEKDKE